LKLSLVSCPVALFPASSEREKISFHQINEDTGNRIKYRKVDAETGDEVDSEKIIKGYEVGKGQYLQIEPDELEAIAIESKRTIEIDGGTWLLETPLRAEFALIRARQADHFGNLAYELTARNFNPVIATATDIVIVDAEHIVPTGVIAPDHVVTPAPLVDYVIAH